MEIFESRLVSEAKSDGVDRLVVGAIILKSSSEDDLELLVLERQADDFMGGIDELPSGKVDGSEQLLEALSREVKEETGLVVAEVLEFIWHFDYRSGSGRQTRQFNFLVTVVSDENVTLNPEEHSAYKWVQFEDLKDSNLTPNIIEALSKHQQKIAVLYRDQSSSNN